MARKRYTTEQIHLQEAEVRLGQGQTVGTICCGLGIAEQTYYPWRRGYGGLKFDQAKRQKDLERENERLKNAVSELTLDKLKEAIGGKYSPFPEAGVRCARPLSPSDLRAPSVCRHWSAAVDAAAAAEDS